jgi:hypothetical protein
MGLNLKHTLREQIQHNQHNPAEFHGALEPLKGKASVFTSGIKMF